MAPQTFPSSKNSDSRLMTALFAAAHAALESPIDCDRGAAILAHVRQALDIYDGWAAQPCTHPVDEQIVLGDDRFCMDCGSQVGDRRGRCVQCDRPALLIRHVIDGRPADLCPGCVREEVA